MKSSVKTYVYPITVEPCEEGGFFASCPILQGCYAEGETYGEAIDNIQDVIRIFIEAGKKTGRTVSSSLIKTPFDIKWELSLPIKTN